MRIATNRSRAALISDLRALADYLYTNPQAPLTEVSTVEVTYFPGGHDHDEEQISEVNRVAHALHLVPDWEGDHYIAEHRIGRAAYRVVAIPEDDLARHRAFPHPADPAPPV